MSETALLVETMVSWLWSNNSSKRHVYMLLENELNEVVYSNAFC